MRKNQEIVYLLEFFSFQIAIVILIVVREHDAHQILFAMIILSHEPRVIIQQQIVLIKKRKGFYLPFVLFFHLPLVHFTFYFKNISIKLFSL